jgi:hypothetical protein
MAGDLLCAFAFRSCARDLDAVCENSPQLISWIDNHSARMSLTGAAAPAK